MYIQNLKHLFNQNQQRRVVNSHVMEAGITERAKVKSCLEYVYCLIYAAIRG